MSTRYLTRKEQIQSFIFFVLYILLFPPLKMVVEWVFDHFFGLYLSEAMSAAVYYLIIAVMTVCIFRRFLKNAWTILLDFLPENLLSFFISLVGAGILHLLVTLLPTPMENPNPASWAEQYAYSPAATIVILVLLMPLIEEILFRGLIYGSLRQCSRTLAWIISVPMFAVYSVWTFAVAYGEIRYLLLAIQYLPMTLALTWCYERGGSIWPTILLHSVINALALLRAI